MQVQCQVSQIAGVPDNKRDQKKGFLWGNCKRPALSFWMNHLAELLNSFHDVCSTSAFFTSMPGFKGEEIDNDNDNDLYPQFLTTFFDEENTTLPENRIVCGYILKRLRVWGKQDVRLHARNVGTFH